MSNKKKRRNCRHGLQGITLCISTALVLILLGMVVFSVLTAQNLSAYVKENLTVSMILSEDMNNSEALQLSKDVARRKYVNKVNFISKEQVLKEQTAAMGTDPSEFIGANPFVSSLELRLKAGYANTDSLRWIVKDLKKNKKVTDITYPQDLMVSVYARRFNIHTMKLVGASWSFIRRPFLRKAVTIGLIAAVIANALLAAGIYLLYTYEPGVIAVITWQVMAVTAASVFLFGILITLLCACFSVNKFLKMKAGDLYKI